MISRLSRLIYKIEIVTSTSLLLAIVLITSYNMAMRWLGFSVGDWFEELVTTLLSWSVFFGIGAAVKEKHLVAVEVVTQSLPPRWKRGAKAVSIVVPALVFAVICYASVQLTVRLFRSGIVVYTMFDIPVYLVMLCIPIASVCWIVHLVEHLHELYRGGGA